jgi:hypothetical protein
MRDGESSGSGAKAGEKGIGATPGVIRLGPLGKAANRLPVLSKYRKSSSFLCEADARPGKQPGAVEE